MLIENYMNEELFEAIESLYRKSIAIGVSCMYIEDSGKRHAYNELKKYFEEKGELTQKGTFRKRRINKLSSEI